MDNETSNREIQGDLAAVSAWISLHLHVKVTRVSVGRYEPPAITIEAEQFRILYAGLKVTAHSTGNFIHYRVRDDAVDVCATERVATETKEVTL